jgi:hypothetical protein
VGDGVAERIELAIRSLERRNQFVARLRKCDVSADSRDELRRGERLLQVVVGSHVEPGDRGIFTRARGQQDDRE